MKRFLFIGHDASRTGAPIVLLHFLRWARENNPEWEIDLLLLRGGELEEEYKKVSDVFVIREPQPPSLRARGFAYIKRNLGFEEKPRSPDLAPFSRTYDAVIGNTVISLGHLEFFKRKGFPTFCWMHELEYVVGSFFTSERFREISEFADQFIVPARAVERFLKESKIDKPMHLVYEFSNTRQTPAMPGVARRSLGIPADAFVVLGSGTIEWRKGVDLFLQIAARITPKYPDIYFVWVGGKAAERDVEYARIQFDLKHLRLNEKVVITRFSDEPHSLFAAADIFALTSREDPFPLVCLEAASLRKPIICFADAGGIPEFVDEDAGSVIGYGDIDAFCNKILDYYGDRVKLEKAGSAAREKVRSSFSEEISCSKIREIISNV